MKVAEKEKMEEPAAMEKSEMEPVMKSGAKATGKAAEKQATATMACTQMPGDNSLAAAYLVNALKSAELTAALNGDKFDMAQETQKVIQMWKEMKREISK